MFGCQCSMVETVMWAMLFLLLAMCCLMVLVIPDHRTFDAQSPPNFFLQLFRIVLGSLYKSKARKDITLPRVQIDVKGVDLKKFSKTHSQFASFCGYFKDTKDKNTSEDLISQSSMGCFIEILFYPLQIAIISDPQFPLSGFGLVHLKNDMYQYREIKLDEKLNFRAFVQDQRWTDAGLEFDIALVAYDINPEAPVWKTIATLISRSGKSGGKKPKDASTTLSQGDSVVEEKFENKWDLPQNTGVKYANISGDYNPFHLYPITALPFGFPGPIAHGMYTLSRTVAEVTRSGLWIPQYPFVIKCEFKRPLILPSKQIGLVAAKLKAEGQVDSESTQIPGLLPSQEERATSKTVSAGVYSSKGIPHLKASFAVHK